jgi:predicted transcriptional regulator of viral defense system
MGSGGISLRGRRELALLLGRGRRALSVSDAESALKVTAPVAAQKLARWTELGWLRRVRRGLYIPVPVEAEHPASWSEDPVFLADLVWSPCYFTGWTSASHWGLTEQIFRTTVLKSTGRIRSTEQQLLDHEYIVEHVDPTAVWGVTAVWRQDHRVLFADPARTVIDMLDEPHLGGGIRGVGDVLTRYLDEHDPTTLITYGERIENAAIFKRLGYLLESLALNQPGLITEARSRLSSGISLLEPSAPPSGPRVPRWGIRANAHIAQDDPS